MVDSLVAGLGSAVEGYLKANAAGSALPPVALAEISIEESLVLEEIVAEAEAVEPEQEERDYQRNLEE